METKNKILFSFPVLYKDEMSKEYLAIPQVLIHGVKKGSKRSLMVTFGLIADYENPITIFASVTPYGQEEEPKERRPKDAFYKNLDQYVTPQASVFLVTVRVEEVLFDEDGLYEINVRIYPSDSSISKENELDSHKSFFYVFTEKDA